MYCRILESCHITHTEALTDAHAEYFIGRSANAVLATENRSSDNIAPLYQELDLLLFTDLDLLLLHMIRSYPYF